MKKLSILVVTAALPFLLVWAAFFLTGFSFNPIQIFQDGTFWGVGLIYWFIWLCLIGFVMEAIDEEERIQS